jgi:hypothetical protein
MVYYIYDMSSLGKDATTEDWAAAAAARRKSNGSNSSAAPSEEYLAQKKADIRHIRSGEASPADKERFESVYALDIEGEIADAKRSGSPTAPIKIPTKRSYSAPFGGRRTGRRTGRRVAKRHTKHLKRKSRKTRKTRTKKSKRPRRRATRRR